MCAKCLVCPSILLHPFLLPAIGLKSTSPNLSPNSLIPSPSHQPSDATACADSPHAPPPLPPPGVSASHPVSPFPLHCCLPMWLLASRAVLATPASSSTPPSHSPPPHSSTSPVVHRLSTSPLSPSSRRTTAREGALHCCRLHHLPLRLPPAAQGLLPTLGKVLCWPPPPPKPLRPC